MEIIPSNSLNAPMLTILLVEDDTAAVIAIKKALQPSEGKCFAFEHRLTVADAIAFIDDREKYGAGVSYLLFDWVLPDGEGGEILEHIKTMGYSINSTVITNLYEQRVLEKCRGYGVNAYLQKPFRKVDLQDVLKRYFCPKIGRSRADAACFGSCSQGEGNTLMDACGGCGRSDFCEKASPAVNSLQLLPGKAIHPETEAE